MYPIPIRFAADTTQPLKRFANKIALGFNRFKIPLPRPLLQQDELYQLEELLHQAKYASAIAVPIRDVARDVGVMLLGSFARGAFGPVQAVKLYELLAPFSGQIAAPPGNVLGTFAWMLGTLAATLERYEQAERHFAAAAEIDEHLGAPLFVARAHAGWARTLILRGRPDDLERARPMLEQAEEAAGRLGAGRITRDVEESRAALAATRA